MTLVPVYASEDKYSPNREFVGMVDVSYQNETQRSVLILEFSDGTREIYEKV